MGMYYNHFRWADQIDGNIDELIVVAMEEHKKRTSRMQKKKKKRKCEKKGQILFSVALVS